MGISTKQARNTCGLAALLAALVFITSCAGITSYEPRNNREEGPEQGLFSGSEGEFVIFRKTDKPKTASEESEKKAETNSGEQQTQGMD